MTDNDYDNDEGRNWLKVALFLALLAPASCGALALMGFTGVISLGTGDFSFVQTMATILGALLFVMGLAAALLVHFGVERIYGWMRHSWRQDIAYRDTARLEAPPREVIHTVFGEALEVIDDER